MTSNSDCPSFENEATAPLDTLAELLEWDESAVNRCLIGQPLSEVLENCDDKRPRTLVCHDMAGGYLEDRFAHGCVAETVYYLREWPYIDIFVYFSHHFVTIPPVGWINAAHTHNVPVLGTFITEWTAGEQICTEFLSDGTKLMAVVDQLARIAAKYKFDGWLLNIENPINHVANLISFAGLLTARCKEIVGPRAMVIWYDSVTVEGKLKWQDALNDQNKCFFDVSDGIFLNYCWDEEKLDLSLTNAGDRALDVYVGVDVFGRGCMGGGGYKCYLPLNCLRQRGLSAAFFATGWVYECLDKREFEDNQRIFWAMIAPGLHCKKIARLPVASNFVPGKRWYPSRINPEGLDVSRCFFCLRDQDLQPHWFCPKDATWPTSNDGDKSTFPPCTIDYLTHEYSADYPGGAILKVTTKAKDNRLRLFCCHLSPDRPVRVSLTYQCKKTDGQVGLALTTQSRAGVSPSIYLMPHTLDPERTRTVFDENAKLIYCQTSVVSIRPDVDLMVADILIPKEDALKSIDLVTLSINDVASCFLHSFSLCYVN